MVLLGSARGQDYAASLSVSVLDPSQALIKDARVALVDSRGNVRQTQTSASGSATFGPLVPGDYTLEVEKEGFDKIRIQRISLGVRDRQAFQMELKIATGLSSITVTERLEGVTTDASLGVALDQRYLQNLPINGRNAESLILMAPGITSASGGRGGPGGFNANGLRSNTNYYTLDGVSVNTQAGGPGGGGPPGPGGRGGPPGIAMGASTELISLDAMQEMRVQTSPMAPEFGRSPGAQVSMTSRGGTPDFHGSLFFYFRDESLSANDWFVNSRGFLNKGDLRQNRPGGTFGGPIIPNKTFFFASFEALRLTTPDVLFTSVPDLDSRQSAAPALRPYLNAFPLPNGPQQDDGAAEFHAVTENPSRSDSGSFRLDHGLNDRSSLFLRYSLTPGSGWARGSGITSPNVVTRRSSRSDTFTAGWTKTYSSSIVSDLRVNYSTSRSSSNTSMDNFGGGIPLSDATVFRNGLNGDTSDFSLTILGVGGYTHSGHSRSRQSQINVVQSVTKTTNTHTGKVGVDYRRTMPTNYRTPYSQTVSFSGLGRDSGGVSSGFATNIQVASNIPELATYSTNFSAYAQDTWRATERTTLTYGLRWDVNPASNVRNGPRPFAVTDISTGEVSQSAPLYETRWGDIAPRVGLAYQMDTTSGREMMLRMGLGLFYDVGSGVSAGAFNGAPYSNFRTISLAVFPISTADATAPVLPPLEPYGQLTAADPNLKSPLVWQWNTTIERHFGSSGLLSVGYVGTRGRRLMRVESRPSFGDTVSILTLATNGAISDYHGLQVQFRRRLAANLQMQLSYTYSHSIDSASNDVAPAGGFATIVSGGERGSSDFDIRHNLNLSGSYRLWAPGRGLVRSLLGDWYADWVLTARTGLPLNLQGLTGETSDTGTANRPSFNRRGGLFAQVRPFYNGLPVWIEDPTAPGGKRLNADAFRNPTGFVQGNLGRNAIRGFGAHQIDMSLRRQISLGEGWLLHISAQAFNVLNHPNFANPSPDQGANLSSPNFGVVTRMLASGGGGASGIYRSGGPRSMELVLRLQF